MGLPGIILKREFVHLFLPSVCAAACVHPFIDWNPGFELPCKWFFFWVRTRASPPPSTVPSARQPLVQALPSRFSRCNPLLHRAVHSGPATPARARFELKRNLKPLPMPAAAAVTTAAATAAAAPWDDAQWNKRKMGIPRSVELPAGFVLPEFRFATLYDDNALDIAFVLKYVRALDSAFGTKSQGFPSLWNVKIQFFSEKLIHVKFTSL